jgi:hypothetical protein
MTRLVAAVMMWLSLAAVVVVAGGHTLYYLLEWEWVRAQIAGIAFVAGLVVAATLSVLARLRRIERRLDVLALAMGTPAVQQPAPDVEPRPDFRWLDRPSTAQALALPAAVLTLLAVPDQSVFIPVFLATGLVVTAVATAVEQISALRHSTPLAGVAVGAPPSALPLPRGPGGRMLLLVPVVAALVVAALVGGLYLASHYWSKPIGAGTTTMAVEVATNGGPAGDPEVVEVVEVVEAVGRYCVLNSGVAVRFRDVVPGPRGDTLLRLTPLLDGDAQKRFIGCLEDAVLEWHQLTVTDTALDRR